MTHDTLTIEGWFRDVLSDASGRVVWDRGWQKNAIVDGCRKLLAAFLHGPTTTVATIQGLAIGQGNPQWDLLPNPPTPSTSQTALVDPGFIVVPRNPPQPGTSLQFDYVDVSVAPPIVTATPTNRLQIIATLGPGVPNWSTGALREFGLIATLNGSPVLLNYRTHPVIAKDLFSTLTRTIWLAF